jgi:LPS sulfotransferase NodH
MTRAIILAHSRSGSTLLGEIISSMQDTHVFGEVCNSRPEVPVSSHVSFTRFKAEWTKNDDLPRALAKQTELLEAYFCFLAKEVRNNSVVFQVKYAHLHHFEQTWYEPLSVPCLFLSCRVLGTPLIHLYRKDVLAAACSNEIALMRGVWHSTEPDAGPIPGPIELNIARVVQQVSLLERQIPLIGAWLSGIPHFSITYEDVVQGLGGDARIFHALASFLDLEWAGNLKVRNRKLGRPLNEAIANFSDLQRAFDGRPT